MQRYIFNARDIAAYFKYFSVPQYLEVSYMQYIFNLGKPLIAVPLTKDFEKFKKEVYRELYSLWANGFEDERSDISYMAEDGQLTMFCDTECINLESYMKLITLHLVFTRNLPYVNLNFTGLPLSLGIRCDFEQYEENVKMAIKALNLDTTDKFGKKFDINLGIPDELLRVSLSEEFRAEIAKIIDFKESIKSEQQLKMKELKEKSLNLIGGNPFKRPTRRKPVPKKTKAKVSQNGNTTKTVVQPKGAPLKSDKTK